MLQMYSAQFATGYIMKLSFIFEKLVLTCSLQHGSDLYTPNLNVYLQVAANVV